MLTEEQIKNLKPGDKLRFIHKGIILTILQFDTKETDLVRFWDITEDPDRDTPWCITDYEYGFTLIETAQDKILNGISKEREFQKEKWGHVDKTLGDWILVLGLEFEELKVAHCKNHVIPGRSSRAAELIQIAACAISALEKIPENELKASIGYLYENKSVSDLKREGLL